MATTVIALAATGAIAQGPGAPGPCAARGPLHIAGHAWARARRVMAPAGVSEVRLCRYAGLNARPRLKLRRSLLVTDPGTVGELVANLDGLRPIKGALSCPTSDGAQVLALLVYANGERLTISVGTGGCGIVTNGNLVRTIAPLSHKNPAGPMLSRELKRLVGADFHYRPR
jgi:hypothetical protein